MFGKKQDDLAKRVEELEKRVSVLETSNNRLKQIIYDALSMVIRR